MSANLAAFVAPPPGPAVAPQRRAVDASPSKDADAFDAALNGTDETEPQPSVHAARPRAVRAANYSDPSADKPDVKSDEDQPARPDAAVATTVAQPAAAAVTPTIPEPRAEATSTGDLTAPQSGSTSPADATGAVVPLPSPPAPTPALAAPAPITSDKVDAPPPGEEAASKAAAQAETQALVQAQTQAQVEPAQPSVPVAKAVATAVAAAPSDEAEGAARAETQTTEAPPPGHIRDLIERASTKAPAAANAAAQSNAAPQAETAGKEAAAAPAPSAIDPAIAKPGAADPVAPLAATPDTTAPTQPVQTAPTPELRAAQTVAVSPVLSSLSHAAIDATAQIAAQIVKKLEGRSTRFEMALTPDDLGRVDVSLDIDADGQLAARLAFDNPLAAADLRSRVDELRRQLQDAGFTVADDALSFAQRDPAAGQGNAFDHGSERGASRAFGAASRLSADAETLAVPPRWISLTLTPDRVDLKV